MRETVLGDTPASFATISRVTAEPFAAATARRSNSDRRMPPFLTLFASLVLRPSSGSKFAAPQHNMRMNRAGLTGV
jgi:hypothetical protein